MDDKIPKTKQQEEALSAKATPQEAKLQKAVEVADKNEPVPKPEKKTVLTDGDRRDISMSVLTQKTDVLNPVEYAQIKKLAGDMHESGAISEAFENSSQIVMAIAAGREMGMGVMESLNGLYFVGGRLNIYGKATPAQLRRYGWRIKYKDEDENSCTAVVENLKTGESIEETYTYQEAVDSGYTQDRSGREKFGWKKGMNRRRKLRYGVLSLIIHTYIPEVVGAAVGVGEFSDDYMQGQKQNDGDEKERKIAENIAEAEKQKAKQDKKDFEPKAVK